MPEPAGAARTVRNPYGTFRLRGARASVDGRGRRAALEVWKITMLPILELKIASTMMAGWLAASSPVPIPAEGVAVMMEARAVTPVEVHLYDENRRISERVLLERDGATDPETAQRLSRM